MRSFFIKRKYATELFHPSSFPESERTICHQLHFLSSRVTATLLSLLFSNLIVYNTALSLSPRSVSSTKEQSAKWGEERVQEKRETHNKTERESGGGEINRRESKREPEFKASRG
jgi:hypothetical protein